MPQQFVTLLTDFRVLLAGYWPPLPWLLLALGFYLLDSLIERFGWDAFVERAVPWGKAFTFALSKAPIVMLGFVWANLTSEDAELTSAVGGALEALARPVLLAVGAWLALKVKDGDLPPPSAGAAALLLAFLPVLGCSPLEPARTAGIQARGASAPALEDREYCRQLDSARGTWGTVAKVSAALGGGTGLSVVPIEDDPDAELALGVTAAVFAATAIGAQYLAEQKSATWARECAR